MAMQLISRRWFGAKYGATCPRCGASYLVETREVEGAADFVDVICVPCQHLIGRVREDFGGNKLVSTGDKLP